MNDEMKSMEDNDVWDFLEFPKGNKPIGCKWIFKTKQDSKGNIKRYKTHLVAKGFTKKNKNELIIRRHLSNFIERLF